MARKNGREKGNRQVGYAVIGLGHIAQAAVLPAFAHAHNAKLVAVVSGDAQKRARLARKYRCDAYDVRDLDEVLDRPDVDAVYVAEPNDRHVSFGRRQGEGTEVQGRRSVRPGADRLLEGDPRGQRRGAGRRGGPARRAGDRGVVEERAGGPSAHALVAHAQAAAGAVRPDLPSSGAGAASRRGGGADAGVMHRLRDGLYRYHREPHFQANVPDLRFQLRREMTATTAWCSVAAPSGRR